MPARASIPLLTVVLVAVLAQAPVPGQTEANGISESQLAGQATAPPPPPQMPAATGARDLVVTVGKSVIVDSPVNIERVAVADGAIAEAVAATPREVLINGKRPGETTLVIWQQGGNRLLFDLRVVPSTLRLEAIQQQLAREMAGQDVTLTVEDDNVFLRGTVNDLTSADRAVAIASTLGTPINLLHVKVPPVEAQVLLKVRFADVDRALQKELGVNLFSTGALNTPGTITTGGFSPPTVDPGGTVTLADALNIFLFRPDLDLGVTIRALQSKRLLEILAEPNLLTINGREASFLAGGEFPYPTLQGGGAGLGAVTIQFREFGIRLNFTPTVTPRGTIRIEVEPEVSSLDFANGLVFQGFTIPALSTRRVQSEIELDSGQSFAIAGLLDNRVTQDLNKIPGLGDIPLLGKLFQSKRLSKNNTELLVMVTPEVVRPIPEGQPAPEIEMPEPFMEEAPQRVPRTPGLDETGPVPITPPTETLPVEELKKSQEAVPSETPPAMGPIELIPARVAPAQPRPAPSTAPAAPAPAPSPQPGPDGDEGESG